MRGVGRDGGRCYGCKIQSIGRFSGKIILQAFGSELVGLDASFATDARFIELPQ